jgi:Endonuclease/Exonuclease/phosphatase family
MITTGSLTGRIATTETDRMGRWCLTTYNGAGGRQVTIITAYQVCNSPPVTGTTANSHIRTTTAVTQQYSMMIAEDPNNRRHPRVQFRRDLLELIQQLQAKNHSILLMGDFNEALGDDEDGMSHIAASCTLVDLMAHKLHTTSFNTYIGGTNRIDYVLASPSIAAACTAAGYEPIKYRFKGDHRGLFMEFDTSALFGNDTVALAPPSTRRLQSRNRANCERYIRAKHKYLKDHHWFDRLTALTNQSQLDEQVAEQLDRDWTRASLHR